MLSSPSHLPSTKSLREVQWRKGTEGSEQLGRPLSSLALFIRKENHGVLWKVFRERQVRQGTHFPLQDPPTALCCILNATFFFF